MAAFYDSVPAAFFMNRAAAITSGRAHGIEAIAIRGFQIPLYERKRGAKFVPDPKLGVGGLQPTSLLVNAPGQARAPICYIPGNYPSRLPDQPEAG